MYLQRKKNSKYVFAFKESTANRPLSEELWGGRKLGAGCWQLTLAFRTPRGLPPVPSTL